MTGDELITAVRRRCRIPDGDAVLSDTEILSVADEETSTVLLPLVQTARSEYYVTHEDQALVADQAGYRIPSRAQVAGLRDVTLVDASGNEWSLGYVAPEEAWRYGNTASRVSAFTLRGDKVVLLPTPTSADYTLRLYYYRRPSSLTLVADAATITTISGADLTVSALGDTSDGELIDVVQSAPNFDALEMDVTADYAGFVLTLPAANTEIVVGDYVTLAGTSPVVQLPAELHPVLVQAIAARVYDIVGNKAAQDQAEQKLSQQLSLARQQLEPRVHGEAPRIVQHGGFLAGRRRWRW